ERQRQAVHDAHVEKLRLRFAEVPAGIVVCAQVWAMQWVYEAAPKHLRIIAQSHESYEAARGLTPASYGSTRYQRMRRYYEDVDLLQLLTEEDARKYERDGFCNVAVM